jgi:hypothetical protein
VLVDSPGGGIEANYTCPKVNINIKDVDFLADLIVLESTEIDVILGRGWLSTFEGIVQSAQGSVLITSP